jgi:hypothetical protein
MVFSLFRGASPSKEKAKFQPLILHCSESSYRRVSDTGGRIGFSAEIKYYLNAVSWVLIRMHHFGNLNPHQIKIRIRIRIRIQIRIKVITRSETGSGSASIYR